MICVKTETDQKKPSTCSRAGKMEPASSTEHCDKMLVKTSWANLMGARERGKGNSIHYEKATAFWCLQGGELSVHAKDF